MSHSKHPMANIPRELRKQIRTFVSKTSDEAIDLVVNLTGKYISTEKRKKLKKKAKIEVGTKIEEAIAETYQTALEITEEYQQKKLKTDSLKEKFYILTDTYFQSFMPEIPKNVHAMDHLFQVCEELLANFRFNWRYLKDTEYKKYLQGLEKLVGELRKTHKINKAWEVLNEFRHSKDFYPLLQATLQRVIKYYGFLERNFSKVGKRQLDKYLEIYEELSGIYEKFISLIVALIQLQISNGYGYEAARRNGLRLNIQLVEKSGWRVFVSGFNRNIRNALAHRTCKIDILKETVEFVDRNKTFTLTFREVQKETRELGALLLILPHTFISIFCLSILSIKEMLESLP